MHRASRRIRKKLHIIHKPHQRRAELGIEIAVGLLDYRGEFHGIDDAFELGDRFWGAAAKAKGGDVMFGVAGWALAAYTVRGTRATGQLTILDPQGGRTIT